MNATLGVTLRGMEAVPVASARPQKGAGLSIWAET
nr:MAG TPA: hypothetical protein [Caudoviricetes sp.]